MLRKLYGIKHGVIVITKIDKVDKEWLDFVEEEVKLFLAGTFRKCSFNASVYCDTGRLRRIKEPISNGG